MEKHPQLADKELIDKVHEIEVMSATPWDNGEDDVVKKQYFLAEYIYKKYESIEKDLHNKVFYSGQAAECGVKCLKRKS